MIVTGKLSPYKSFQIIDSHVILPKELAKTLPKSRLLTENEWRGIGVQQSRGWQHYALHRYVHLYIHYNRLHAVHTHTFMIIFCYQLLLHSPEPHILLFRRVLGTNPQSGRIDPELVAASRAEFKDQMGLRQNSVA